MRRIQTVLLFGLLGLSAGCNLGPPLAGPQARGPDLEAETPPAPELPPSQAAQACLTTAKALAGKGYIGEAIQEYKMARAINPHLPGLAWQLAVLYDKLGDFDRAEIEYQSALEAQPHNAELLNDVGYYHYRRGQPSEAEKYLRQALEQSPGQKNAWGNLGMVLGTQGRAKESYEAFVHVVRPAQAHANVGILLARAGQQSAGRQELQQALALEPNLPQARAVLARLDKGQKPVSRNDPGQVSSKRAGLTQTLSAGTGSD